MSLSGTGTAVLEKLGSSRRAFSTRLDDDDLFSEESTDLKVKVRPADERAGRTRLLVDAVEPEVTLGTTLPLEAFDADADLDVNVDEDVFSNEGESQAHVALADKIDAVVTEVDDEWVVVECKFPKDEIELVFPKDMLPEHLAEVGQALIYSIKKDADGFETPTFISRTVKKNPHFERRIEALRKRLDPKE